MITDAAFKDGFGALITAWPTYGEGEGSLIERGKVYQRMLSPLMGDREWRSVVHRAISDLRSFPTVADLLDVGDAVMAGSGRPLPREVSRARDFSGDITTENFRLIADVRQKYAISWGAAVTAVRTAGLLPQAEETRLLSEAK